jgi:hypothetical protein
MDFSGLPTHGAGAGVGQADLPPVVGDRLFPCPDLLHDRDVVLDAVIGLAPGLPVPAFDDLRPGYTQPADGAVAAGDGVEGGHGHGCVGGCAAGELQHGGAETNAFGVRGNVGQRRDGIGPVGLCRPDGVVAETLRKLHVFERNAQFSAGIAEHESELHVLPQKCWLGFNVPE